MKREVTVLGIVGSYRKSGNIDTAMDEILKSANARGAAIRKTYLIDQHIEFCTNCRTCCQEPGAEPGECIHRDDLANLIKDIQEADAIVIGSPVNFGTVNAVTKRFIERLICLAYWPWGAKCPQRRSMAGLKPALIVVSSAAPAFLARWSGGTIKLLRQALSVLGARPVGELCFGLVAQDRQAALTPATIRKAHHLGRLLVGHAAASRRRVDTPVSVA